MSKPAYTLVTSAGCYYADNLLSLALEVLKHRWWHLKTDGVWVD